MIKKFLALRKEKTDKVGFRAEVTGDGVLHLEIHDVIGQDFFGDGVTHATIAQSVKDAGDFKSIFCSINSPGGDVFDAVGIYNLFKQQGKPVNVTVDGLAASAASVVAMAGDTITMGEGSQMMIHNPMAMAAGSADDMRKMADILDGVAGSIADIYVAKTGMKKADVQKMMTDETWMNSTEAVNKGFADSVMGKVKAQVTAKFDLALYNNVPDSLKIAEGDIKVPEKEEKVTAEADPVISVMRKRIEILRSR